MTRAMTESDWKQFESLSKWFAYDENNYCVLRDDTPKEAKKALEKLQKKYQPMFD